MSRHKRPLRFHISASVILSGLKPELRKARDWSQQEMAAKLNMSTNGYAKIERGETKASIPKLEQIADIFEVELMELLAFGEKHLYLINDNSNTG